MYSQPRAMKEVRSSCRRHTDQTEHKRRLASAALVLLRSREISGAESEQWLTSTFSDCLRTSPIRRTLKLRKYLTSIHFTMNRLGNESAEVYLNPGSEIGWPVRPKHQ